LTYRPTYAVGGPSDAVLRPHVGSANEVVRVSEELDAPGGPELRSLLDSFETLRHELNAHRNDTLDAVAHVATRRVPGARWASVSLGCKGRFWTAASTGSTAIRADSVQYELGSGPCVDAMVDQVVYHPVDLRNDPRWPEFGRRVADEVGIGSMVSYRLVLMDEEQDGLIGGLNLYSDELGAFDDEAVYIGYLIATHGAVAAAADGERERAEHLLAALQTSREIGTAMGVLMARHGVTRTEAFDLLKLASQRTNRKLRDVATDVADTGVLDLPRRSAPPVIP
jgi:hypothetical protein